MDSSRSTDRIDIVKLIVILVLLVVLIGAGLASGFSSSRQQAENLPEESAEPVGMLTPPANLEDLPAVPAPDQELTYNPADGGLYTEDGQAVYTISPDGTAWIPVVPPEVAGEVDNPVPIVDANGTWVLVDSAGMVQYEWDEATLSWVKVEVAYLPQLPADAGPTGQPAAPTAVGTLTPPADIEGLPAVPAPDQELTYNPADGSLYTEDGQAVYTISPDGTVWIPVVPPDLAGEMGDPVPAVDANGEWVGVWVLVDSEGMAQYQWDDATLSWVKVEVAYLPNLPGEAGPTEQPAAGTPASPEATTAAPDQTSGAAATEVPPAGETSPSTSSAEAEAVPVPASLLTVPKTYSLHAGEFPFCLARRFNVNPMELLYMNGLNEYSVVFTNTKLRIPTSGKPFPPPRALLAHPDTYTVKAGDTIYTIACKYGDVYPEAIAYANQLSAPYRLKAGQSLYIP